MSDISSPTHPAFNKQLIYYNIFLPTYYNYQTISTFTSFFFALPFYIGALFVLWLLSLETYVIHESFLILVLLRSSSDTFAEWFKMKSISYGDISVMSSFLSLAPVFLLFLSSIITGEEIPMLGYLGVILVVVGSLLLIHKPGTRLGGIPRQGIYCAVAASFFFAINNCFDKLAVQTASPTLSGFIMTLISAAFLLPGAWRVSGGAEQLKAHTTPFVLRGFFEVAFMVGKLSALIYLPAPYVMALVRGALLLSIVGGKLAFNEPDFVKRLLSGILVVSGLATIILAG